MKYTDNQLREMLKKELRIMKESNSSDCNKEVEAERKRLKKLLISKLEAASFMSITQVPSPGGASQLRNILDYKEVMKIIDKLLS